MCSTTLKSWEMNRYVRPRLRLKLLEQVEDLRLGRNIQRGHRLVADHELQIRRQGTRHADALALPAAEGVR